MEQSKASSSVDRHAPQPLVFWLALLLLGWFIWNRFGELDTLIQTLKRGRPLWILLAVGVQALFLLVYATLYQSAFRITGVSLALRRFVTLVLVFKFVNTTVTSAGAAGSAFVIERIRRNGETRAIAMAGMLLVIATDYAGFVVLLTVGVGMLLQLNDLTRLEAVTSLVMYGLVAGISALLSAGLWAADGLQRRLSQLQRRVNWLGGFVNRPNLLAEEWARNTSADFIAVAHALRQQPKRILLTMGIALTAHLLGVLTLQVLFWAFNTTVPLTFVITLYAMTTLFTIVTPTPGGVGIVETVMPAVYVSLGVPLEVGIIINLAFRGITFWLPVIVGFFALRWT